jgi:uncharacterized low-complexity protein
MKLKTSRKTLSIAVATAFGAGIALSPMAMADSNPFGATQLSGGYMQIADAHAGEGKCGEGKCGDDKAEKKGEGSCGEGKCGGDKAEGAKADKAEGKCGEGKCGG